MQSSEGEEHAQMKLKLREWLLGLYRGHKARVYVGGSEIIRRKCERAAANANNQPHTRIRWHC